MHPPDMPATGLSGIAPHPAPDPAAATATQARLSRRTCIFKKTADTQRPNTRFACGTLPFRCHTLTDSISKPALLAASTVAVAAATAARRARRLPPVLLGPAGTVTGPSGTASGAVPSEGAAAATCPGTLNPGTSACESARQRGHSLGTHTTCKFMRTVHDRAIEHVYPFCCAL